MASKHFAAPSATLALSFLLFVFPGEAATWRVTKTVDDNGPCLPDDCSLREAVLAAHESPEPDVIEVPGGVHRLTLPPPPAPDPWLPRTGALFILGIEVEIRGLPDEDVIVDAGGLDSIIHISTGSDVVLVDLTLRGGRGFTDGGISSTLSSLQIVRCTIEGNSSTNGFGGGLRVHGGQVRIRDSSFVGNTALRNGGGILFVGFGRDDFMELVNSTVSGNSALNAGGIYALGVGRLEIVHTTIADNSAANQVDGFLSRLQHTSFSNSLIVRDECAYLDDAELPESNGGNLESPSATCFDPADGDLMGVPDALLGPFGDHGGPTPTYALLPESPAVDGAVAGECEPTDQRGVPRPQGLGCDIGAFELEGPALVEVPTVGALGSAVLVALLAVAGTILGRIWPNGRR